MSIHSVRLISRLIKSEESLTSEIQQLLPHRALLVNTKYVYVKEVRLKTVLSIISGNPLPSRFSHFCQRWR